MWGQEKGVKGGRMKETKQEVSTSYLQLSLLKWRLVWRYGKSGKEPFYVKLPFNKDDEPCTNDGDFDKDRINGMSWMFGTSDRSRESI
jgi:hypothetical protein